MSNQCIRKNVVLKDRKYFSNFFCLYELEPLPSSLRDWPVVCHQIFPNVTEVDRNIW